MRPRFFVNKGINTMSSTTTFSRIAAIAVASVAMLSACGGGGGGEDGSNVTASQSGLAAALYVGPIQGFGSVIVNGMRFSSVGAVLDDDDGNSLSMSQLKLGMTVRVSGNVDDASQSGSASHLEVERGTRGTVTATDIALGTISILGQTVRTDGSTTYQGTTNLASLVVGQTVEIYGSQQSDGSLLATLVEVKAIAALSLGGRISNLNTTTNRFDLGGLTVNYSPNAVQGTLVDGVRVKVKAASGALSGNVLTATRVQVLSAGSAWGSASTSGVLIKVKGVVEAAPVSGRMTVSGTPVNVANASIEGGATITAGTFVEVKGTWDGSTLQATKVELEGAREARIGGRHELYGSVSSLAGAIAVVNGVTVDMAAASFSHGTLAEVVVGSYVEVKGNVVGDVLQATKVELKSGSDAEGVSFEQYGQVTDFVSISNFKLAGTVVDASQARFEGGSATAIRNTTYLEIKGSKNSSGIFVATKVEIK